MNNIILDEVDKIISIIKESDEYKDYNFLKNKLLNNKRAVSLINEIKKIQRQLVKKQANKEDITELDNQIKAKLEELNRIPLYVEFIEKQEELNEINQMVKNRLEEYFFVRLN